MNSTSSIFRKMLLVLFRKKIIFITTIAFCVVIALFISYFTPKVYSGSFTILVKSAEIDTAGLVPGTDVYVQAKPVSDEDLANEVDIFYSDLVLGEVVARVGERFPELQLSYMANFGLVRSIAKGIKALLPEDEPDEEGPRYGLTILDLKDNMEVVTLPGSHAIEVKLDFYDQEKLAFLLKTIAAAYQTKRGEVLSDSEVLDLYSAEADRAKASLMEQYENLSALEGEVSIFDTEKQRQEYVEQLTDFERERNELEVEIQNIRDQLESVKTQTVLLGTRQVTEESNPVLSELETRIIDLRGQRAELLTMYLETSPNVANITVAIDQLQKEYRAYLVASLESRIKQQESRLRAVNSQLDSLRENIRKVTDVSRQLDLMQREIEQKREDYEIYTSKRSQVEVQSTLRARNISTPLLRPPSVLDQPVWPIPMLLVPLSIWIGFFISLVYAWISHNLEDLLLEPEDLEQMGLRFLGSIQDSAPSKRG